MVHNQSSVGTCAREAIFESDNAQRICEALPQRAGSDLEKRLRKVLAQLSGNIGEALKIKDYITNHT